MDNNSKYIPGTCNIGKEEINKRKKLFIISLFAVIALTRLCFEYTDSFLIKTLLFLVSSTCCVIYMELRHKFCVTFGMFGFYNFNKLGKAEKVKDRSSLLKDRQKVLRVIVVSSFIGLVFTFLICALSS